MRSLPLAAVVLVAAGCYLRDGGHDVAPAGTVDPAALCPAAADGCPPCSTADGARCRDRFYDDVFRCDGDAQCGGARCVGGFCLLSDADGDGLDDTLEREAATRNFPRLDLDPYESCGGPRAVLYRVDRHAGRADRLSIAYVVLYDRDCGEWNGHLGDNEAFALTIDLGARPGAPATVGVLAQAHRNTFCESTSTCSAAAGTSACATDGEIVVYGSRDKHANYLDRNTCEDNCFDKCGTAAGAVPRLLDVGQEAVPLVRDLTAAELVRPQDGWAPALLHFDPWGSATFGDAGHPRDQLTQLSAPPGS